MTMPFNKLSDYIAENGFQILPIQFEHAMQVSTLDFRHRDPFDRLIISQGIVEKMPIISGDKNFDAYPVQRIW